MKRDSYLLVEAVAQFTLFIPVTIWANKHKQPPVELAITHLAQKHQTNLRRHVVQVMDVALCSSAASDVLTPLIALFFWKKQRPTEAIATFATVLLSKPVQKLIKKVVQRPRPNPLLVLVTKPRIGSSFPSGDVAATVTLWGWLLALGLYSRNESNPAKIVPLSIPAFLLAFVGPARIYMGDHWATDVLGGYLFGGGWLCLSLYVYRWLQSSL